MNIEKRSKCIIMLGACLLLFTGVLLAQDESTSVTETAPAEQSGDISEGVGDSGDSTDDHKYAMLMAGLTIFVISIFVGVEVITKVPQKLHTPLMSGSNAISGITIVGAILVSADCAKVDNGLAVVLVGIAIALAMINVVGGFGVTHRMLSMFTKRKKTPSTQ